MTERCWQLISRLLFFIRGVWDFIGSCRQLWQLYGHLLEGARVLVDGVDGSRLADVFASCVATGVPGAAGGTVDWGFVFFVLFHIVSWVYSFWLLLWSPFWFGTSWFSGGIRATTASSSFLIWLSVLMLDGSTSRSSLAGFCPFCCPVWFWKNKYYSGLKRKNGKERKSDERRDGRWECECSRRYAQFSIRPKSSQLKLRWNGESKQTRSNGTKAREISVIERMDESLICVYCIPSYGCGISSELFTTYTRYPLAIGHYKICFASA